MVGQPGANTPSNNSQDHPPSSSTRAAPAQFNSNECSKYLSSRHTAEMEALASNQLPSSEKPELYKPPGPSSFAGGWGSGKYTSMANGQDFLLGLSSKLENSHNHSNNLRK
ncbi:hypothetical protein O181_076434 [Austropuccinia psidii MF-1]|uniref:Uncharacterized protein n=1 Tax=Austropuccinia psidii MF-1 TaxID=1389203 RepID=A0A9Q3FCY4_9BASI|nr:hypothetical protein [Austropuccinia psidii MF-1]